MFMVQNNCLSTSSVLLSYHSCIQRYNNNEILFEGSEVRTKTTKSQFSPVQLELVRLVSSLLYGTRAMLVCFLLNALQVTGIQRDSALTCLR